LIDRRGLDDGDLMLAERLADDFETAGERRITKSPMAPAEPISTGFGTIRFFRVDEVRLRLGERCC
jgi:hypothetical protein